MCAWSDNSVKAQKHTFALTCDLTPCRFTFLSSLGVSFSQRKLGSLAKPTVIVTRDNDVVTIRTETVFKVHEISFRLGQEFEETTMDNRHVKVMMTALSRIFFPCVRKQGILTMWSVNYQNFKVIRT